MNKTEGYINMGGDQVKDTPDSILEYIRKTFPNVTKIRKDKRYGWVPVFKLSLTDEAL
jgi:hypothetical protein